jgi:hypothetical protein
MGGSIMIGWNSVGVAAIVAGATALLIGCASMSPPTDGPADRILGAGSSLGEGTVSSYAEIDGSGVLAAIGVVFSATALDGLPVGSDRHHCVDRNEDGSIDEAHECLGAYEYVIPLPDVVARRSDVPFKWVLLNWNPGGHIPPGIYDLPHFDVHFYMEPIAKIFALESGLCGPEFMRCDQYELARRPLPPNYMHSDFQDVGAAVPAMGNHLVDLTSPEFHDQVFKRTWIYGTYDGAVTFYEEMVTRTFLLSKVRECYEIKSPAAVGRGGFYPSESCIRHDAKTSDYTVSLEKFVFREASDPEPID